MRQALIDGFRDHAEIMIATEAAAEGINLQFCSLIVNYDLPWNPQRIEQRIGRCHRYGQKHDVVVINFLNEQNWADQRIYQLLKEKFKLFDGVFGASDEILGRVESGIDFEKRILDIFETCRKPEEIERAFAELQSELDEPIQARIAEARNMLFEHFDEEVHSRLKFCVESAKERLDLVTHHFWQLTKFHYRDMYHFNDEKLIFGDDPEFIARGERPPEGERIPIYHYLETKAQAPADPFRMPQRPTGKVPVTGWPYLRVLADEIFGRANFVATVVWQKVYARDNRATISTSQDYIHVYAKNAALWKNVRNLVERDDSQLRAYRNPDNDPRGVWKAADATAQGGHGTASQFYEIILPSGEEVSPPPGRCWLYTKPRYEEMVADGRIWFGLNGRGRPAIKRFLSEVQDGVVPTTWWPYNEVGHNQDAKKEALALFPGVEPFATPKPERLIQRVLEIATNPGDLVLDSFAGSGTTGAVAHKMERRWIMIELGEHCHTHIIPRLQKVISGEDQGGISETVGWKGGGGFQYYSLAPSLITFDKYNQPVINKGYNPVMLSQAMCKLMGFTYAPSDTVYWQQGHSTETDFIYVTTQTLDQGQLSALSEEAGENRTLLICCAAFRGNADKFENLTVKKIPRAVLDKCEWDKDDYSLNVQNLPMLEPEPSTNIPTVRAKRAAKQASGDLPLFGDDADAKKTSVKRK